MEIIQLKYLAEDIDTSLNTLYGWLGRWTLCKYLFSHKEPTMNRKLCIKGTKDFYKSFSTFLETRKNGKYLKNFQEKYNYLLDK